MDLREVALRRSVDLWGAPWASESSVELWGAPWSSGELRGALGSSLELWGAPWSSG